MKFRITAVMIAALLSVAIILPFSTAGAETAINKAVVNFQPSNDTSGVCVPPIFDNPHASFLASADYSTTNTADAFIVRVNLWQNLCTPITAKAAIYSMPGDGVAWPQQLVSVTEISIQQRGVYTFTFPKTCLAQQFDIIVGATPQTISPAGPYHGPLLFPVGLSSALQWWGFECVEDTVVTTEPTTTTTTVPPISAVNKVGSPSSIEGGSISP